MDERTRRRSDRKRTISENQQFKSENQKLRRENARLRKQLERLSAAVDTMTFEDLSEDLEELIKNPSPETPKNPCPKCGQPLREVELGPKMKLVFCSSCSHRERKLES